MKSDKLIPLIVILSMALALVVSSYASNVLYRVSKGGRIVIVLPPKNSTSTSDNSTYALGVYWDEACTHEVEFIDLGEHYPGEWVNFTIYVKNLGNVPVNLTIDIEYETAGPYNLFDMWGWKTYNNTDFELNPGEVLTATIMLHVNERTAEYPGEYAFTLYICVKG